MMEVLVNLLKLSFTFGWRAVMKIVLQIFVDKTLRNLAVSFAGVKIDQ